MNLKSVVLIPTYNEKENIEKLINEIFKNLPDTEIVVIDDNSPDNTGEIVERLSLKNNKLHVIHGKEKSGLGTAYVKGFHYALDNGFDVIFQMDADFSHNPKYLPVMQDKLINENFDLVIGSRYVKGGGTEDWGILRKLISRGGGMYSRTILGLKPIDITGGFKCFKRQVLEAIHIDEIYSLGFGFQIEVNYRVQLAGFKIAETPIIFPDRKEGKSKMSGSIFTEALINVWKLKFNRSLRSLKKEGKQRLRQK